jgi:hypothetical protein
MVEVFKTNVENKEYAQLLLRKLMAQYPNYQINFDLQDCDHILRVEGNQVESRRIIEVVSGNGFDCQVLE